MTESTEYWAMGLVLVASLIGSVGAAFLKVGANRLHRPLIQNFWRWSLPLGVGVGFFVLSSAFYIWAQRGGSLTVLFPLLSLGYVWTLLWSRLFFGEPFNKQKVAGLVLVLCGVISIGFGNS